MGQAALEGLLYGLFLAILIGPLLVTLLNTSIEKGIKAGMSAALGIWISDLLFIYLVMALSLRYADIISSVYVSYLACIAGITFLMVGVIMLLKTKKVKAVSWSLPSSHLWHMVKGFLVNTINPFTLVFWTSLATNQIVLKKYNLATALVFFGMIMLMIVITDTIKVVLANKITPWIHTKTLTIIQIFSAIVFVVMGVYILWKFLG